MNLLVLGGTGFVGRVVVAEAVARRVDVTVVNRGHRPAPPGVTAIVGDRTTPDGLAGLPAGDVDLVVDTWSGAPRVVRDAARQLAGRARRYAYVSSRSVYVVPSPPGAAEDAPVVDGDPDAGDVDYPQAKRGAEIAVQDVFGDRAVLARAGLVLGPHEDVGRLPWWLHRIARGGTVAAPGPPELPLQYIDARDLAAFLLDAGTQAPGGAYNVVSAPGHTTMRGLLDACVHATGSDAQLRWVTPEAIAAAGVQPWSDLPCWLPPGPLYDTLQRSDVSRALAAGLRCRPVEQTVADTWQWLRTLDGPPRQRPDRPAPGLSAAAEHALLRPAGTDAPRAGRSSALHAVRYGDGGAADKWTGNG